MAETVYALCALSSGLCAFLLFRGFRRSGARLLLWSGACFVGLVANNILLFVDLIVVPQIDLSVWRAVSSTLALAVLVVGLIWESR